MSRDNKRRPVFALILVTFLMSACSVAAPWPRSDVVKAHRNTIVFSALSPNASYWEHRIAAFEAANPSVHVVLQYERITDDWAGRADVVLGPWPDVWPKAISKSSMLDLTPLIEGDPTFDTADFYPGALDLYRQDGYTWAIPIGWSFKAIAYLPTVFQEKGVSLPTLTWTWADVIQAARHLSDGPTGYPRSFATDTDLIIAASNWLAEEAGSPYLQQGGLIVPALDSPRLRRALADYQLLAQELSVLYAEGGVRPPAEILDAIVQGKAGMSIIEISRVTDLQQRFPQIALAPLPPGEVAAHEAQQAAAVLFINAGTVYPMESWRWLRFVSQQDLSPFLGEALSTRRSIAEASEFWKMSPAQAAVIRATIANHADRPRLTGSAGILATYQALWRAIWDVQYADQDVGIALGHAQSVALAALRTAREQNAVQESPSMVRTPTPSGAPVIEFQAMWDPEIYRQAAVLYAADDATVPIQVSVIESGLRADCMEFVTLGSASETVQLVESLETLEPWLEATRDFAPDAFFPDALAAVSWQDELYGIPVAVKPPVLRFRPELFHALGLALPSRHWTMEEVIQTAQEIKDGGRGYFGLLPQAEEMVFLLDQLGVPLFTSEPPIHPRFTASDVGATVARLARLGDEKVVVPASLEDALMLISSGRVAMWFDGITLLNYSSVYGTADVTAIQLRPMTPFPMQTTFLGIVKGTSQTQSCWAWITFLVRQGIHPPDGLSALQRQAASEAVRPGPQQTFYAAALETLQRARSTQTPPSPATEWAAWWLTQAMRETAKGADLAAALQTAQDKAEAFLACLGPASENDLDRAAQCARQVDPAHPLAQIHR